LAVKAEKRMIQSLDQRLPALEYFEKKKRVDQATAKLAKQAEEFILATGSRSRNKKYLKVIERKVIKDDVPYWRIILGTRISHGLCEHLTLLLENSNVLIRQIEDMSYGNLLIVDTGVIIALPIPGHGELMGIEIPNKVTADRLYKYFMMIFPDGKKIITPDEIKALCEECSQSDKNNFD
jgi:hypothetical protein